MIYFDNAATAPVSDRVMRLLPSVYSQFGFNPSSKHPLGMRAFEALREARLRIASLFGCPSEGIYFTSGATEAANILIQGIARHIQRTGGQRNEIVLSGIEHAAVFQTALSLMRIGWAIRFVRGDTQGRVSSQDLIKVLGPRTAAVCVMTVNNETGTVQNIGALSKAAKDFDKEIIFVTDAVQSVGKLPIQYNFDHVDSFFSSGHKFGATKGCGFFYLNPAIRVEPILFGGGQEGGYRPGTTDACAAYLLSEALQERMEKIEQNVLHVTALNRALTDGLTRSEIQFFRTIELGSSSPYILSISLEGVSARDAVEFYADRGICVSTGSACSSTSIVRSRVLQSLGLPSAHIDSIFRVSFSIENTLEQVECFVEATRQLVSFYEIADEGLEYAAF